MTRFLSRVKLLQIIAVATLALAFGCGSYSLAQVPDESVTDADLAQPLLPVNDLENLAAPIALYPDALLSQVLVASTYPTEVFEAAQFLQQNRYLAGRELMQAAQEQNWDPSIQALVAFPDVLQRMNDNLSWATELGNAFLAQQGDVMSAIQNLRAEARKNGQLQSGPQLRVNTETQEDRSAIEIQPGDPQRMYVPNYDPYAVWGAPAEGDYPQLPYAQGNGFGEFFGTVANLAGLLPGFGGLLGPRSWGWAIGWLAQTLFVNNSFFSDFGFHNYDGEFRGSSVWAHNERHRLGVPYGNRFVAGGRGRGTGWQGEGWRNFDHGTRASADGHSFLRNRSGENFARGNVPRNSGMQRGGAYRGFSRDERQVSRGLSDGWQMNRTAGRDYSSNLRYNRGASFGGSRSFGPEAGNRGFGNSGRRMERSRSTAQRSWSGTPRVSAARMSSERRYSSRGLSSHGLSSHPSSSKHGFSSHSSRPKAPKAPHYAKSHGGGHSSGGHGGKRSHRG